MPVREQNIPFAFGLDTEKGFPHQGVSRVRRQQVYARAPARSSSAARPRTRTAGSFLAPASESGSR